MDFESFQKSLKKDQPPQEISELLQALWWDAKDDWDKAHKIAQDINDVDGAWVHAYLHRKEGDQWNAGYWYSHAGRSRSSLSLEEEWEQMVRSLLEKK